MSDNEFDGNDGFVQSGKAVYERNAEADSNVPLDRSDAEDIECSLAGTDLDDAESTETGRIGKLRRITRKREASELRAAEESLAAAGVVRLSELEQENIHEMAETESERRLLIQEAEADKLRQYAMYEAKKKVNPAVPAHMLVRRPSFGPVSGTAQFHMRDSFAFLLGRNYRGKPHISGLFEGASAVRTVVQGFHAGCPYAAWYLYRIEDEMDKFRKVVKAAEEQARALVASVTSVVMNPYTSKYPAEVSLVFQVKYGFLFVDLLRRYDEVLRVMKAYEDAGFVSREDYKVVESPMGKSLRQIFRLPVQWSFVGRDAVLQKTQVLFAAEQTMGILPEGFLDGTMKPRLVEQRGHRDATG